MRVFFDTSVLVAAVLEEHEHHSRSFSSLSGADRSFAFCAAHNMAEAYATLTRYPGKQRLNEQQALLALSVFEKKLMIVALEAREYLGAIRRFAALGIVGGTIYDGLIAACALKAKADALYTWNIAHFLLLGDDVAKRVRTP
ncbi:MAG TPA: PIN domain-containing protein [Candidatus Sulfotelmatobacter sp.]|nr:PIN domain-containing protein [Candidatus Sulfotelmatobacter sp.]